MVGLDPPDFDRPSGTGASLHRSPGTSCLATISLSLRDKSQRLTPRLSYRFDLSGFPTSTFRMAADHG
jgi:hypothetical protein